MSVVVRNLRQRKWERAFPLGDPGLPRKADATVLDPAAGHRPTHPLMGLLGHGLGRRKMRLTPVHSTREKSCTFTFLLFLYT